MKVIAKKAVEMKGENKAFRTFLKSVPTREVDNHVFRLSSEISSKIDCTQCANCCKTIEPGVTHEEITRLASYNRQISEEFVKSFVGIEPGSSIHFLNHQPCIFLKDNKCSIYNGRPSSCEDYPHLHHPQFKFRFKAIIDQYAVCPIVFNVVEELKQVLNFEFLDIE